VSGFRHRESYGGPPKPWRRLVSRTVIMVKPSTQLRLETQLDALDTILAGATAQQLAARPPSGAWSAHEHLAHLARHHAVFLDRLRRVEVEDAPRFGRYRAEDDPEWPAWSALESSEAIARLRDLRAQIVQWVASLSDSDAARVGVHPLFGEQSVGEMLEFFLAHEGHHLYVAMTRLGEARASAAASRT
jgi:uncharacterized damage-inducible protein DinB